VLQQPRLGFQCGGEEAVGRDEQHREGRRGPEGGRVAASRQGVDVGAQLPGVHRDPLVAHRLIGRLHRLDVAGERHLGVDDHLPPVRQRDHEVGADAGSLVVDRGGLLDEVAVLQQARHLDHPAQLHLTPSPAHVRGAQGGDQGGRLVPELRRGLPDGAHLLAQLTVGGGTVALDAGQQPMQVVQ
jgi:hypothetical protein